MDPSPHARPPDWLGACRRAAEGVRAVLERYPTTRERAEETGRGEGGDLALVIDRAAEDVVFSELESLHREGHRFTAISEERGPVDFGGDGAVVVVDPIDGSMNAKRGLPHHALSVAVADGATMADVAFGYVYDFGPREEWRAVRGEGAWLGDERLAVAGRERRTPSGALELLGIESADPRWVADAAEDLRDRAGRVRAIGAIALSLCQVAGARLDGMATLRECRSVDSAAGQLVVREAGGHVAFPGFDDPLGAPLALEARYPVVAALTDRGLAELADLPRRSSFRG